MDKRYQIVLVVGFLAAFTMMAFSFTADIFMWGSTAALIFFAVFTAAVYNQSTIVEPKR